LSFELINVFILYQLISYFWKL